MDILKKALFFALLCISSTLSAQNDYVKVDLIEAAFHQDILVSYERVFRNFGSEISLSYGNEPFFLSYSSGKSYEYSKTESGLQLDVRYYAWNYKEEKGTGVFVGMMGNIIRFGSAEDAFYEDLLARGGSGFLVTYVSILNELETWQRNAGLQIGYKLPLYNKLSIELSFDRLLIEKKRSYEVTERTLTPRLQFGYRF